MKQPLPNTLSARVQYLRENLSLSREKLAALTNVPVDVIYNLEEGRELFLSVSVRQRLSKALRISANTLKEVERLPNAPRIPADVVDYLRYEIVNGRLEGHTCPKCGADLICKVVTMYDLEDLPVKHPKARCKVCPFQIK